MKLKRICKKCGKEWYCEEDPCRDYCIELCLNCLKEKIRKAKQLSVRLGWILDKDFKPESTFCYRYWNEKCDPTLIMY